MEFPGFVGHLWEWFKELDSGRDYTNEGAALPFGFDGIEAWAVLMNVQPSPYEVLILKQLDNLFIVTK